MTVKEIYDFIDGFAPFSTQCEWDNSGLIIGSFDTPVTRAGFALDATPSVIREAAEKGCELLITHHPVIFHPVKSLRAEDSAYIAARCSVAVLAAHTPFDLAEGGVNTVLADLLGIKDAKPLCEGTGAAMCRAGKLASPLTEKEFAQRIAKALGAPVKYVPCGKMIETAAVCGGAGAEFIPDAVSAGIDAFVTGEAKHHELLLAQSEGLPLFVAGHYETEYPAVDALRKLVEENCGIECILLSQGAPAEYTGAM